MIFPDEQKDDLQNGYYILQKKHGFRYGIDAVLLADFAKEKAGPAVLDMGTGTGIIPILLAAKTGADRITGLEIQPAFADMAKRSVAMNKLDKRVSIIQGDIREAVSLFGTASFDTVTCNPPYMIGEHGLKNPDDAQAIARHEVLCTFDDIAAQAAKVLRDRGRFYLIHRPFRLVEIFGKLTANHLEPKRMRMVYPYADREPNLVLIEACKGGKSRLTVEKPLFVYNAPGVYTKDIRDIYGDGR